MIRGPDRHHVTDPRCTEYAAPGHPERPERVSRTVESLKKQDRLGVSWAAPAEAPDAAILRAHTREHLDQLKSAHEFDADTPAHPGSRGMRGDLSVALWRHWLRHVRARRHSA